MNNRRGALRDFDTVRMHGCNPGRLGRLALAIAVAAYCGHILLVGLFGVTAYAQSWHRPEPAAPGLALRASRTPGSGLEPALHFTHLTADDGLAQNTVTAILQDRRGFMWIGTSAGLSRYDGYHFTTQGGGVWDGQEDATGNMWLPAGHVLAKYDPRTERFAYYAPPAHQEARLSAIRRDSTGNFWIGGTAGLYRFDVANETFTYYPAINQVNDLLEDEAGNYWVASLGGLYVFDPRTGQDCAKRLCPELFEDD